MIQYGICRDIPNLWQRGGRSGRDQTSPALFLIMYESRAKSVELPDDAAEAADPDAPIHQPLKKHSTKQERTGMASLRLVKLGPADCIRLFVAVYLNDKTEIRTHEHDFMCSFL